MNRLIDLQKLGRNSFQSLLDAISAYQERDYQAALDQLEDYAVIRDSIIGALQSQESRFRGRKKASISVVIVTHDKASPSKTMSSISSAFSNGENLEVVVAIGGTSGLSPDEIISAFPAAIVITLPINIYPSESRNFASLVCASEWLFFLDDDAVILPESLAKIQILVDNQTIHAIRGKILPSNPSNSSPKHYDLGLLPRESITNVEGCLLIRRSLFSAAGGFDPLMYGHEGEGLWERCINFAAPSSIIYDPSLVVTHEPSQGSKLIDKERRHANASRYLEMLRDGLLAHPLVRPKAKALIILSATHIGVGLGSALAEIDSIKDHYDPDILILGGDRMAIASIVKIWINRIRVTHIDSVNAVRWHFECANSYDIVAGFVDCSGLTLAGIRSAVSSSLACHGEIPIVSSERITGILNVVPILACRPYQTQELNRFIQSYTDLLSLPRVTNDHCVQADRGDIVVCSFYTKDPYYSGKARVLKRSLDAIDIEYDIRGIEKPENLDWAEICRLKADYMYRFFAEHCSNKKKIVWIDVDCNLAYIPKSILDYECDLMGFARGFKRRRRDQVITKPALNKGRFWEPSFFVFKSSIACENFLYTIRQLERDGSRVRATDDFFIEEAWRKHSRQLSYYVFPGESSSKWSQDYIPQVQCKKKGIFFIIGSSGNVPLFKDKVVQHPNVRSSESPDSVQERPRYNLRKLLGMRPEDLKNYKIMSNLDYSENDRELATSLLSYQAEGAYIPMYWWSSPSPGNMGDWLSPYIVSKLLCMPVKHHPRAHARLISLGSIAHYICHNHVVWGTGIARIDGEELPPKARYLAVRGPYTAEAVKRATGKWPTALGDPGLTMRVLYRPNRNSRKLDRCAFVRHYAHQALPLQFSEDVDDLNILMSSPRDIEQFIDKLLTYSAVATTSLHVRILCDAYFIPCALVSLNAPSALLYGDGVKYRDYAMGVGVPFEELRVMSGRISSKDIFALASSDFPDDECIFQLCETLVDFMRLFPARLIAFS